MKMRGILKLILTPVSRPLDPTEASPISNYSRSAAFYTLLNSHSHRWHRRSRLGNRLGNHSLLRRHPTERSHSLGDRIESKASTSPSDSHHPEPACRTSSRTTPRRREEGNPSGCIRRKTQRGRRSAGLFFFRALLPIFPAHLLRQMVLRMARMLFAGVARAVDTEDELRNVLLALQS